MRSAIRERTSMRCCCETNRSRRGTPPPSAPAAIRTGAKLVTFAITLRAPIQRMSLWSARSSVSTRSPGASDSTGTSPIRCLNPGPSREADDRRCAGSRPERDRSEAVRYDRVERDILDLQPVRQLDEGVAVLQLIDTDSNVLSCIVGESHCRTVPGCRVEPTDFRCSAQGVGEGSPLSDRDRLRRSGHHHSRRPV